MKSQIVAKKVFTMMSGGVDSSVAAALLKEQGFEVTGIFMKNWSKNNKGCTFIQDHQDARRVAARLGIPFYTMNFEKEYYNRVFSPFIKGIKQGKTPNPDIFCNQEIKFGIFLEKALELGADMVATGHYARVRERKVQKAKLKSTSQNSKVFELRKAKDGDKDQTYFLYRLNQFQLSKTLFPIGDYEKSEVRAIAKKLQLSTATKPDSQGICFVGKTPFEEFLTEFVAQKPGYIFDAQGKKVGNHRGVPFYTIGQRKGLRIGGLSAPLFVAYKDNKKNTLIAVPENHSLLYRKEVSVERMTWISGKAPILQQSRFQVRFRHQQPLQGAQFSKKTKSRGIIRFARNQRAITPGQSIVLYEGQRVVGGGIISV